MKIPFWYGNCQITFSAWSQPDEIGRGLYFKIDQSSFFEVDEWADKWISLARSKEKDIYGYHFNFDLKLLDNNLQSASTQNTLTNFLYYYNRNLYSDKRFYIQPYRGGTNPDSLKGRFEVITLEYPKLTNIAGSTRAKGQYLNLKCETKFITDKDDYDYIMYRETSDDSWGILIFSSNVGTSSTAGSGRPLGMVTSNLITDGNDRNFESGTIGNWVVYTDGSGTSDYIADSPGLVS